MAISPEAQYAGKINPSTPQYPYGSARNITTPGDGTGTPWESALVNDLFGWQQALLSDADVVPSGTPDEVGASQYLQATKKLTVATYGHVATMVADTRILPGGLVRTISYLDGWGALAEPEGGATYSIATLQQVRDAKGDPTWEPDEFGDHTLANGLVAVLLIEGGVIRAETFGLKKNGTDDSAALQAALDRQISVSVGAGRVSLSNHVQIKYDGQALFGYGTYNTELEWIGTDNTKNMIELWSGRRDQSNNSLAVTNQRLENFKISTKTGSSIQNLIWVESGCFHGWIQKIRGFDIRGAIPTEAIIKYDSNGGQSYALGMNMRDVVVTGGLNDSLAPVPRGIWLESCIEGLFESVKVFTTQIGWQFGTSNAPDARNVTNCTFLHCQSEIGDRGFADGNARAMLFYQGRDLTFQSCKIMAGADYTGTTTQLPLRFSGVDGFDNKSITFDNCTIWGNDHCFNAMEFDSIVNYQAVKFLSTEFFQYLGALAVTTGDDIPTIYMDEHCTFIKCEATISNFDLESSFVPQYTVNNVSGITTNLQTGNDTTQTKREEAILMAHNSDTQGVMLSAYKTSPQIMQVRGYNRSGANVTIPDGYFYTRGIGRHNSDKTATKPFNPPTISSLSSESTTVILPGAQIGDLVVVNFDQDMQDVNLFAYVSAVNTVTVYFVNRASDVRDLDQGMLRVYKLGTIVDYYGSSTYDPPSLNTNGGITTTVTVGGAKLGDIAVFSFSNDLQGVVGYAWVSAADTVSVRFQNESGGVVDLASGTLLAGVIETPTSL